MILLCFLDRKDVIFLDFDNNILVWLGGHHWIQSVLFTISHLAARTPRGHHTDRAHKEIY